MSPWFCVAVVIILFRAELAKMLLVLAERIRRPK